MIKLIIAIFIVTAFLAGGLIFFGLNVYSNLVLIPKMRKKGIIDRHEAFWAFMMMTPIPALRDYLGKNDDDDLSIIYTRLHLLSKLVVWLIAGSISLAIILNIFEII